MVAVTAIALGASSSWLSSAAAQDETVDTADVGDIAGSSITVATKPIEPFVLVTSDDSDGSGLRGFSIDLWNEIADRLGVETTWVVEETVTDIIDAARTGRADAAIAGISMTPDREAIIDFAHPYFDSGLQVATRTSSSRGTFGTVVDVVTSPTVLGLVAALIALVIAVAHVVWWSERRVNPEFPEGYRAGIAEALWWSSVNIVTGGEAVKDIRRPLSRMLALGWMVIGLFLFTFVTAQAASTLTVNELDSGIDGIEDLAGERVVTIAGTVGEDYLAETNLVFDSVDDIDTALSGVADQRWDAVVYDSPVLAYRTNTDFRNVLTIVGSPFAPDPYGIALTTGSALREPINAVILELFRDGTLDELETKWLGT